MGHILKSLLIKIDMENTSDHIFNYSLIIHILFAYRNTSKTSTGKTPAGMFLNDRSRNEPKQECHISRISKHLKFYNERDMVHGNNKRGDGQI